MNLSLADVIPTCSHDNDDATVITSNRTGPTHQYANAMGIAPTHAIADTGATSIFVMAGSPANNIRPARHPINISLPDGKKITSTQVCDINIPGLPVTLMGHIVPDMKMASLLGVRVLCKAGYTVIFDNDACRIIFDSNTILTGHKDPTSDLWTLPILPTEHLLRTTPSSDLTTETPPRLGPCKSRAPQHPISPGREIASFSYHRSMKENAVKFMHQSLGNPPIRTFLKLLPSVFSVVRHTSRKRP